MRIGIVGYASQTGLGELNRQFAKYVGISAWLVIPHRRLGTADVAYRVDTVASLLDACDVVLFAERPFLDNLIPDAVRRGKRVVCVPMLEWLPPEGYPGVDLYICPTRQCFRALERSFPCAYFPWPVDTERFEYRQRTRCDSFLFVNGHGGWRGRKGGGCIDAMLRRYPELPVRIRSQIPWFGKGDLLPEPPDNTSLYSVGDMLLLPHSVDGIGLEAMEAMAAGMPVIATDGETWNELPLAARIRSTVWTEYVARTIPWYVPDPEDMARLCDGFLGEDISHRSIMARRWAESRSWGRMTEDFRRLVCSYSA